MRHKKVTFIRYPGGKQRILNHIIPFLPSREFIEGRFIEPFVGSGAVFFALNPKIAILANINPELIDLYHGLRCFPLNPKYPDIELTPRHKVRIIGKVVEKKKKILMGY